MNTLLTFDILQKEKLGKYIYALRDPRDGIISYIRQGLNNKLFEHFNETDNCLISSMPFKQMSSKDYALTPQFTQIGPSKIN
ncbi:MAG TPA: hypothetical protein PKD85_02645 [Saprospiraceae bacterium]|nr:hypothetical protein [Saprospiraceae bacterium]